MKINVRFENRRKLYVSGTRDIVTIAVIDRVLNLTISVRLLSLSLSISLCPSLSPPSLLLYPSLFIMYC